MENTTTQLKDGDRVELHNFEECDETTCPRHGGKLRKIYRYGSSMSAETDLFTFYGCNCSVAIRHDPVGTYPSTATYYTTFADGVGRLHAKLAAAKYRD